MNPESKQEPKQDSKQEFTQEPKRELNRDERAGLLSQRGMVERMLAATPESDVLDRASLEARLRSIDAELAASPADGREPARVKLTFRGRPVVGSRGVVAEFGTKATQAFADLVAKVAASLSGPLAGMGPVPNRNQYQLLITGTALGSFGFELEEHRELPLLIEESGIAEAIKQTQQLLEGSKADDDALADAVAGLDRRAVQATRTFLGTLMASEAMCTIEANGRTTAFLSLEEVRRGQTRLAEANIHEEEEVVDGELLGVLPKSRTFEFRRSSDGEVIRGKVESSMSDPGSLNERLKRSVRATLLMTRVGHGRPRYLLRSVE
jgi:hypothetical protein